MRTYDLEQVQYIIKILTCAIIITLISMIFDQEKSTNFFLWATLTACFTLQFDKNNKVNFNQITGNIIGSIVGIGIWLLISKSSHYIDSAHIEYLFLVLGIFLTTLTCILLKHAEYCGIALSSFLIVTVYDVSHHSIEGALYRITFCITGCLIAYLVDIMIRKLVQFCTT